MGFKKPNLNPKVAKTPTTKGSSTPTKPKSNPTTPKHSADPKKRNIKSLVIYGLLGLVILTLIIALVLFFVLFNKSENVCKTPECINLAHQLHNFRDDSVDPCDDFYKYSCGKYIEHNSVEGNLMTKKNLIMGGLIQEFILKNASTTSKSEMAMKQLYSKCEEYKQKQGKRQENLNQIKSDVQQFGSWPMTNPNFDLTDVLLNTRLLSPDGLQIDFGIFTIQIAGAHKVLIMKSSSVFQKEQVETTITDVYGEIFKDYTQASINEVVSIGADLYFKKLNPEEVLTQLDYSKLKSSLPQIDFDRIFRELLGSPSLKDIDKIVHGFGGFHELVPEIHSLIETKRTALADFLIFRYMKSSVDNLPDHIPDHLSSKPCHTYITQFLPWPATRVFVRNHFDKEGLKDVEELVEEIRSGFIEMFESSEWLDDSTKKNAIRKAGKMKKVIGYAKHFESPGALDKIFDVVIHPDDKFHTILKNIERFSVKLGMNYGFFGTHMHPAYTFQANAFYTVFENTLSVLTPLMDDPFYHKSYPTYAKLAGTGYIIGHEIGHGFDARGAMYDENGNLKMWWTPKNMQELEKRVMCLIHHYDNYNDPDYGKKLHGNMTITENMADNLGSEAVWRVFKKLDLSNEKKIVGFEDYSIEKLYFQIEALNWCAPRSTLPLAVQLAQTHATSSFRVNGVFANMKEFSEAFNCPAGSPMNPTKKCELI